MPEKSQKRKLRSDQSTSQIDEEIASSTNDENTLLSDRDFEDISNKIENRISKRLKDTELNQREILKLIENLSSKVDNLSSTSSERSCVNNRATNNGNSADEVEEIDFGRSEYSNRIQFVGGHCKFHRWPWMVHGWSTTGHRWSFEKFFEQKFVRSAKVRNVR